MAMAQEQDNIPSLTRQEAEEFITQILMEKMPERDVISAKWINRLIKAFHSKVPYQTYVDLNPYVWLRNKQYFRDPDKFLPERWLRSERESTHIHPYILNPFSIGTRMCAGRRFAEQDLYVGLCRLLLKFRLVATDSAPPSQEWRMLLRPKPNIPLRFIPRE
ncbi:hypothetical protein Pmani_033053 [Petrolisthes manimaculis]|uniref:Cytochrome P450 n=1 Tax=Petrolisthes manimaculis TaxID=1843537 RepID=A0AAE1NRR0_9EUCA|nr:hypothetical protein Pmani_033053 [Petrolisthes manimaculis]